VDWLLSGRPPWPAAPKRSGQPPALQLQVITVDLQQVMAQRVMELQAARQPLPLRPLPRMRVTVLQVVATARRRWEGMLPQVGLRSR